MVTSRLIISILVVFTFVACFGLDISALAHPGKKDALGCHRDKSAGDYHCHNGPLNGQHFRSRSEAEKLLGTQTPVQFKFKQLKKKACGSNAGFCTGCGCKGGTGYRSVITKRCVGHKEFKRVCGSSNSLQCVFENAPGTGANRACALGE